MPVIERENLTLEKLRETLAYDPDTGTFHWKVSTSGRVKAGGVAGTVNKKLGGYTGYVEIRLFGRKYQAHRLAFFLMTGTWPKVKIDHIDRNGLNNSWRNLREATNSQNLANSIVKACGTTGFKGVQFRDGQYHASIRVNGHRHSLGSYDSKECAAVAYATAAKIYFGEFARP